ncbi:hypothetical protein M1146_03515 [Patescibacteria group bacterium]|nr:hypothetical protein [Patescibacteria group bacterium]
MEEAKRSAQNVQVVVRCRPVSQLEIDTKQATVCKTDEASRTVEVKTPQSAEKKNIPNRTYTFDAVYGPSSSQRDIYTV